MPEDRPASEQITADVRPDQPGTAPSVRSGTGEPATWGGEKRGDTIGPYTLLSPLGEGGFGVVWLAERRQPMVQRVAMKIIKPGMDSKAVIARFEQERQALALMDHPNVARVLDGGVTPAAAGSRPYFVMELVKGEPITEFCDRARQTLRERLELFVTVCDAVQHAHMKGLIHRDIKPSNVLVAMDNGRPHAKVIDFGVAKATSTRLTDKTLFTERFQIIGTPEYMSPEQAEGLPDIDTRTDVYALGVILYELLSGSTPFATTELRSASYTEIQRIIRDVEPPAPSVRAAGADAPAVAEARGLSPTRLLADLRGELDWISMRAMEKERARRYESASQFAEDVRRYLRGDPVVAAPPSRAYRLKKTIRRHRVEFFGAGIAAAALVLGVMGTTWGMLSANRERALAQRSADRAAEAERTATARLAESEATIDFLDDMLAAADPTAKGKDVTVRALIDESSGGIGKRFADRPLVAARLHGTVGRTYSALGLYDQADPHITAAYEVRKRLLGPDHEDTRRAYNAVCESLVARGKPEAEEVIKSAVSENEAKFGRTHPVTLRTLDMLVQLYSSQSRPEEVLPIARELVEARTKSPGPDSPETVGAVAMLAMASGETGDAAESDRLYAQAIEAQSRRAGPDDPLTINIKSDHAWMMYWTAMAKDGGDSPESKQRIIQARELAAKALEGRIRVLGEEHKDTLATMSNLASMHKELGNEEEAERLALRALELSVKVLGEEHPDTIVSLANFGNMMRLRKRHEEALMYLERAVKASRIALPPDNPGTAYALAWRGGCLWPLGRFAEAESSILEAHGILVRAQGPDSPIAGHMAKDASLMYAAWDKAEPGKGYDARAAEWKGKSTPVKP